MTLVLKVAVPVHVQKLFDYLPPNLCSGTMPKPGTRLKVPFGRSTRIGILMDLDHGSEIEPERLRPALEILDSEPLLRRCDLEFLRWTAGYYHYPLGEVLATALPALLRQGRPALCRGNVQLRLTPSGYAASVPSRAKRQLALLKLLQEHEGLMTAAGLSTLDWDWRTPAKALEEKGLLVSETAPIHFQPNRRVDFQPNPVQRKAIETITGALDGFSTFLLEGVTGSGKTEVYLGVIEEIMRQGRQALVLFPEIALTPQLQERFEKRLGIPVCIYHSGLSASERLHAWLGFQRGEFPILLGTRSAVFAPMARPGLIVVDEEHDPSFKQQEGFRFSARDLAVVRARLAGIPIVMGSATPSLESIYNAQRGKYHSLRLPERAGDAVPPTIRRVDIRNQKLEAGLTIASRDAIIRTLDRREQVLIFLNRRGFAPVLICHACGWTADCPRCDARLVLHQTHGRLRCHHCDHDAAVPVACPSCGATALLPLGQGTERVEKELASLFPEAVIGRIDRDTTRSKGSFIRVIEQVHSGQIDILLGTQMLAKGHHFPNVTLVVILDADAGMYSTDFRASERMAQLITQVAGRAGRGLKPGQVLIQTRHPDHPLLAALLDQGYSAFASRALEERRQAELPPFSFQALLRADALQPEPPCQFMEQALKLAQNLGHSGVTVLGPVPAPMPKRAGRYRFQLLLQASSRTPVHRLLDLWLPQLEKLPKRRTVRWSVDIDPVDLY